MVPIKVVLLYRILREEMGFLNAKRSYWTDLTDGMCVIAHFGSSLTSILWEKGISDRHIIVPQSHCVYKGSQWGIKVRKTASLMLTSSLSSRKKHWSLMTLGIQICVLFWPRNGVIIHESYSLRMVKTWLAIMAVNCFCSSSRSEKEYLSTFKHSHVLTANTSSRWNQNVFTKKHFKRKRDLKPSSITFLFMPNLGNLAK